ncbi:MAG: PKD domain-containing protein [Vicinamibacterales bacterium]
MVKQLLSTALVGLMVFNSPAPVLARPEPGSSAAAPAGDLLLASNPSGAGAYVDGVFAGQTPMRVTVPAGDHRVRFVRDGYLENARVVSVSANRSTNLDVRLTRHVGAQAARLELAQGAGGPATRGGSKLPWLLAGVGGGFAGGYLFQKSRTSDAPASPANRAPVVGTVVASPSIGLMSATAISFSAASVSDADGDTPTFDWDFGDTVHSTLANPAHTYTAAGTYPVKVTIGDGKGGMVTSAATNVVIKSLTGTWTGALSGNTTFNTTLVLTQSGSSVTGTYSDQVPNAGTLTGAVSATAPVLTLSVTVGGNVPFVYLGTPSLGATTDTITGVVNGSGFTNAPWTLSR